MNQKNKFDYSWVIIGICFLMICIGLGFCSSGRTLYLTAITDALGISRGAFSLNDTFRFVTTTIVNLFFGTLVARFGTKKLICAGFICLIGFTLINATASELYAFYIGGILLGVGLSWTGTTMVSVVLNKWCTKNKGTITGAVLAANGLGGALSVQLLTPVIFQDGNPFGYRNSYNIVTLILVATLILVMVLYREKKNEGDDNPENYKKKRKARGTGWVGMEYEVAKTKPYLYVAMGCMFLTGMTLQGLGGITVPHLYDLGLDVGIVANISSISSILMIFTKFLTGYMYDKYGMKITMNIAFFSAFVSMFTLMVVQNTPLGIALAFARLPFAAIALPLETVMLPLFASEFFGNKSFDKMVGLFVSASTAGFAVGSPFANVCHDIFGSYRIAFIVFAVLMIAVTTSMQYVYKAAKRDREIILKSIEEVKPQ